MGVSQKPIQKENNNILFLAIMCMCMFIQSLILKYFHYTLKISRSYCNYIKDTSNDWDREKDNLLGAYWNRLTSTDKHTREAAASAFVGYELSVSKTFIDPNIIEKYLSTPSILIPFAVMEVHYMTNNGFMKRGQLLDNVQCMADNNHRVAIAHGRADYVCQPQAAWRLTKALKKAGCKDVNLEFVAGAGHSDSESGLVDAMVRATDKFRDLLLK